MVKIGMIIGDRYEILEKIGTGGMSDVYKARDQKLSRNVAVKVLKQEFSENENFVSKFRVEAQAAAGLMHQNIVNVYDVGEEQGIYYIVMELVEGITLKKYIEKKARLTYKEAVSIAIQVGLGIEAAHEGHIIHRDIKPQNIIISKDGKVKVTDFGIAKAATSNTITSNVMGSVHYTSPEQARGGYSDEKSDIYSLGVTMFEMLTGRVPFNGETTVAIAIKHIQEEMPSPREYVGEIPYCVEDIVMKCCEKSPDRRYQNMHELVDDLKQALLTPEEDFVVRTNPEAEGGTRAVTDEELQEIRDRSERYGYQDTYRDPDRDSYPDGDPEDSMRLASEAEGEYYGDEEEFPEEDDYDYNPKLERVTTILAIVAGIIVVGIIIFLAVRFLGDADFTIGSGGAFVDSPFLTDEQAGGADNGSRADDQASVSVPGAGGEAELLTMPTVVGARVDDARNALIALGLAPPVVNYEESEDSDKGLVLASSVEAGESIAAGSTVTLTVGSGTDSVEMPDVMEKTYEEAYAILTQLAFVVNKAESYSDTVDEGFVIAQNPEPETKAEKGCVVTITVSLGAEERKVQVPSLVGLDESDAIIKAVESGLQVGEVKRIYTEEQPEGKVCTQSLEADTYVDEDTEITLLVSLGADQKTYRCSLNAEAPTVEEAPDYTSGTEVSVKLVDAEGKTIMETRTSSFPVTGSYYGLTSASGTLTFTYTVVSDASQTTDEQGNVVTVPGQIETRSFVREILFEEE